MHHDSYISEFDFDENRWEKYIKSSCVFLILVIIFLVIIACVYQYSTLYLVQILGISCLIWFFFLISFEMMHKSLEPDFSQTFFLCIVPIAVTFAIIFIYFFFPTCYFMSSVLGPDNELPQPVYIYFYGFLVTFGNYILPFFWFVGSCFVVGRIFKELFTHPRVSITVLLYSAGSSYAIITYFIYLNTDVETTTTRHHHITVQEKFLLYTYPYNVWLLSMLYTTVGTMMFLTVYLNKVLLASAESKLRLSGYIKLLLGSLVLYIGLLAEYLTNLLSFKGSETIPSEELQNFWDKQGLAIIVVVCVQGFLVLLLLVEGCRRTLSADDADVSYVSEPLMVVVNPDNFENSNAMYRALDEESMEDNKEFAFDTSCCICLEEYTLGDKLIRLKCGHVIHKLCMQEVKRASKTCPLCRKEVF